MYYVVNYEMSSNNLRLNNMSTLTKYCFFSELIIGFGLFMSLAFGHIVHIYCNMGNYETVMSGVKTGYVDSINHLYINATNTGEMFKPKSNLFFWLKGI